ncbi:MAG TPA: ribosome small subunit-dependent GTPase A [Mycobacteriales bacterium]|nr:ribosome small subunit-dependent GTPase A [Mycobacteriales bacterium]
MSRRELDEDDVRSRATPGSRPRTRTRPRHDDAVPGLVLAVDRGRFGCLVGDTAVIAMRGGDLRRTPVVVGDDVSLVGDVSGQDGALARIVRVGERRTVLRRTPDDDDPTERVLVANAEVLVIVVALAAPPPRPRLVDRLLVAAYDGGLQPLLCLTKRDLGSADSLLALYRPLGVEVLSTGPGVGDAGVELLRARLSGRMSVLVGHSGVGKSTLVNRLVPDADRAIGAVTAMDRGRHTSSSTVALPLPDGGWAIDTPGVRSFGLGLVKPEHLLRAFPDLADAAEDCFRGCTHGAGDTECAIDAAIVAGAVDPARLASWCRLLDARLSPDDDADTPGPPDPPPDVHLPG